VGNRYEQIPESPIDRGASAAPGALREAMRKVENRFKFLRELVEFPDPDRPRAA
jgi:hypothetical protein